MGIRHRKKEKEIRMTSWSSDSGELQESRSESCRYTHGFQCLWLSSVSVLRLQNCPGLQMPECVLVSERFLDPLNWRKKNIWIDDYSFIPNI